MMFRSVDEPLYQFTFDWNHLTRHHQRLNDFLDGMGVERVCSYRDCLWILDMTASQRRRWDEWLAKLEGQQ